MRSALCGFSSALIGVNLRLVLNERNVSRRKSAVKLLEDHGKRRPNLII